MGDYKPILLFLLCFFVVAGFMNIVIKPYVDVSTPQLDSVLYSFSGFVEDGWDLSFTLPVIGALSFTFNPVTMWWLGLDSVTDFMVTQINLLSYLPDYLVIPMAIVFIISLAYVILTLVRGN